MGKLKKPEVVNAKKKKALSRNDMVPSELQSSRDGQESDNDQGVFSDSRAAKEGKRKLHEELKNIANNISELLEVIQREIHKEDGIRQGLLTFLKWFLCMVAAVPPVFVIILVLLRPAMAESSLIAATVTAVLAIPVSVIGVLKCVADNLFNDTYRSTLPGMIQDIVKALSQYNNKYK